MSTVIAVILAYWITMMIVVSSASVVVGAVYVLSKIIKWD